MNVTTVRAGVAVPEVAPVAVGTGSTRTAVSTAGLVVAELAPVTIGEGWRGWR